MVSESSTSRRSDVELWPAILDGDREAYEVLVRRHQAAVTAVAYGQCGDLAASEDVAQETFWNAWLNRSQLQRPDMVRAWLCGMARNLGRNSRRRETRRQRAAFHAERVSSTSTDPADQTVSEEEESLVWEALEQIPENYREPLVLYYREHQSVSDVASALDLSGDAVRQRLARGRAMLREQVAALIEGTLNRSRPGRTFTMAVMAGLAAGGKVASAATGNVAAGGAVSTAIGTAATSLAAPGAAAGAVLGPLAGLFGGWLGATLPAQLAPTEEERVAMQRSARMLTIAGIAFAVLLTAVILAGVNLLPAVATAAIIVVLVIAYVTSVIATTMKTQRIVRRLRERPQAELTASQAALALKLRAVQQKYEGRRYRSLATCLGWPLIDIQVSDPGHDAGRTDWQPLHARGWIAVGDRATGIVLAAGGRARGLIAFGGIAIGGVSCGGVAIGLVSLGGLGIGLATLGGLALGALAIGGGAVGWIAAGGGALAVDTAVGGGAVAGHAAWGGLAIAKDLAVGGMAIAEHANDAVAKQALEGHWLKVGMDRLAAHPALLTFGIIALSVLPSVLATAIFYRRRNPELAASEAAEE